MKFRVFQILIIISWIFIISEGNKEELQDYSTLDEQDKASQEYDITTPKEEILANKNSNKDEVHKNGKEQLGNTRIEGILTKTEGTSIDQNEEGVKEIDKPKEGGKTLNILMYHPWGTKSHRGQQRALILGLLQNGHKILGVFADKSDLKHKNYTEVVIDTR